MMEQNQGNHPWQVFRKAYNKLHIKPQKHMVLLQKKYYDFLKPQKSVSHTTLIYFEEDSHSFSILIGVK